MRVAARKNSSVLINVPIEKRVYMTVQIGETDASLDESFTLHGGRALQFHVAVHNYLAVDRVFATQ